MWFIGSFSLPTGIFREKKKNHDCFIFCFPLLLTTTDCPLSRGSIGYTHPLSITHSPPPPPHSYFFVERVMVITRELLSLSCVGPSIHFESHFHCARKEVPSKSNEISFLFFSFFPPSSVLCGLCGRLEVELDKTYQRCNCRLYLVVFCIEVIYIRKNKTRGRPRFFTVSNFWFLPCCFLFVLGIVFFPVTKLKDFKFCWYSF